MTNFNPHARWDRQIPQSKNTYTPRTLDEKIEVLALFKNGKILPRAFLWNNTRYKVTQVTYNWQERCGNQHINYFSVDTGTGLYQISFNNTSYGWRIDKVIE